MAINQMLRIARKRRHWSQTQAGQACGVDLQTFYRWEHGEQEPHGYNLDRLCDVFGAPMETLGYAHLIEMKATEGEIAVPSGDQHGSIITLVPEHVTFLLSLMGDNSMDHTKRETLHAILMTAGLIATPSLVHDTDPWERLMRAKAQPATLNAETITHFEMLIATCWNFSNSGALDIAEETLSTFLPKLIKIAPHHSGVAGLASRGLQLMSIFSAHRLKLDEKLALCQQSVTFARNANDQNTLVTALAELAVAYKYINQREDSLRTYQEALLYAHSVSPLLQSRIYAAAASAFALCGRIEEAHFYIHLAYKGFPMKPEQDPNATFADCGMYTIAYYDGLVHIAAGDGNLAWEAFDRYKEYQPEAMVPERNRLEIVSHKARAALLSQNLDRYILCMEDGLSGSIALNSKKRFEEVASTYQHMPKTWVNEPSVKVLAEQYYLQKVLS